MTMMKMKSKCSNSVKISRRSETEKELINCQKSDLEEQDENLGKISHSYSSSSSSFRPLSGRRMILSIFLVASLMLVGQGSGLRINSKGGYEDVVVSIGNEVPPITCQQLIQNLKNIFISASEYLNTATNGRAYFHRVNIIVPAAWDQRACGKMLSNSFTSASSVRDSAFRIGGEHPVFGHTPWTQQSKGCGKPGDMISAGYQYVLQYNDTETGHSIPERAFVHEWAKFRYGVFEEIGFENDPIYPTAYYGTGTGGSKDEKKQPTSCTNRPLQGNWSGSCNDASGANSCAFVPFLNGNENITSSLMSHPHLPHVKSFCDSTNHHREAPTKHNFLCDHKSISEVIYSHPDFHNFSSLPSRSRQEPEFVIKQLTQPRFVLMVEETGNMNLRDVWKYLKLATRKFIKYDLPSGTQIGLMTVSTDVRILANMTTLDDNLRGILAEKLPNYPNIESGSGTLSLRKGISQSINMLKSNGQRVGGSVIILISQGTISSMDLEASVHLLKQEEVALATIEYPSIGDGKISALSQATNSPHFAIRETGVGTMSHMSTYIQLVNSLMEVQRFYTRGIALKWPTLIHQAEFKGDAPSVVESQFNFDSSQLPAEFHIYIPTPIDPKVNKVELTSPSGTRFLDHTSSLHDINVMKMGVLIDQPGIWRYRIDRLGDSHQSHFVQVVTSTAASSLQEEVTARVYSNVFDEARGVNMSQMPLILYTEVRRGLSPVIDAEVEAMIVAGTHKWSVKLFDNGNGDPDLTKDDGIYSRYIIPPSSVQSAAVFEITVKVRSSPYKTKYIGTDAAIGSHASYLRRQQTIEPCCGSRLISSDSPSLKTMPYTERVASYSVKVFNVRTSNYYPPSRIGDLRLVDSYDTQVTLSFTAPGDDYDHKTVEMYHVFYSRSFGVKPSLKEQVLSQDIPAGSEVNMTISLPSYGVFYLTVIAIDPYKIPGKSSNIVQVRATPPPPETNTGSSESQVDIAAKKNAEGKLGSTDIALIIVGVIAFFILLALIIILCIYCRRRSTKGMGSTETKISTISETKAPIHWSASQLLSEHEKRQSMYAPSTASGGGAPPSQQGSYGQNQNQNGHHHHHQHGTIGHYNGSPGSSTRSFRSISDNARKTSVDYESCSSDPTVRSAKGPTDYETPIESELEENYRTIDSYHGGGGGVPPYRLSGVPHHNYNIPSRGVPAVNSTNSSSHMQYNPNIQGSLTSVNSKARRNITMV